MRECVSRQKPMAQYVEAQQWHPLSICTGNVYPNIQEHIYITQHKGSRTTSDRRQQRWQEMKDIPAVIGDGWS